MTLFTLTTAITATLVSGLGEQVVEDGFDAAQTLHQGVVLVRGEGAGGVGHMGYLVDVVADAGDFRADFRRVRDHMRSVDAALHEHLPRELHVGGVAETVLDALEQFPGPRPFFTREGDLLPHGASSRTACAAHALPPSALMGFGSPVVVRRSRQAASIRILAMLANPKPDGFGGGISPMGSIICRAGRGRTAGLHPVSAGNHRYHRWMSATDSP